MITDKCIFNFNSENKAMQLESLHPNVTLEEVLDNMSFQPLIPDTIPETEPPTDEQIRLIRDVIDPNKILLLV